MNNMNFFIILFIMKRKQKYYFIFFNHFHRQGCPQNRILSYRLDTQRAHHFH